MPAPKYLSVLPNPHAFLDADGNPAGAFPRDAADTGGAARYVGATVEPLVLDPGETMTATRRASPGAKPATVTATLRPSREKVVFRFDTTTPEMVPNTGYYRQALQRGEIFPADEATARAAGVKDWKGPEDASRRAGEAAAARHVAERGEAPSWAGKGQESLPREEPKPETRREGSRPPPPMPEEHRIDAAIPVEQTKASASRDAGRGFGG